VTIVSVREDEVEIRGSLDDDNVEVVLRGMSREQSRATNFAVTVGEFFVRQVRCAPQDNRRVLQVLDIMSEEQRRGIYMTTTLCVYE
jgi:hypothetical protein